MTPPPPDGMTAEHLGTKFTRQIQTHLPRVGGHSRGKGALSHLAPTPTVSLTCPHVLPKDTWQHFVHQPFSGAKMAPRGHHQASGS